MIVGRDDRILPVTRALAMLVIPFLLVAAISAALA